MNKQCVNGADVVGRSVNSEHLGTPLQQSVLKHGTKDLSSAMKEGCCGAGQKALISLLESTLALDP